MRLWRKTLVRMSLFLVAGLVLAACPGDDGDGNGNGTVSLLHGITGSEEQAALQQAIDAFEEDSGITVEVEASPDFETVILTRVQGGNPPDVAFYPQPGQLERLLADTTPLADAGVDLGTVRNDLVPGMLETGTFDGTEYGVVVKLGFKSLLWYAAEDFEAQGYEVPETWDELGDLTDQIAQDTAGEPRAPWCIGIESGGATGWVATDWIEDIMLRMHGADAYDQWVAGDLPFDSPEVRAAFEELEAIWFNEDYVLGGTTGILQTPFLEGGNGMFEDPPACYLHRQAGFIAGEWPGELGTDYDVAYLPPMTGESPALFAGDLAAIHTENPAAARFLEFLVSTEGQRAWMGHEGAGSLSVRSDFDAGDYPTDALARQGEIFAAADVARFDASDMMPGEVGAGTFWSETVAWLSGAQDLDTTLSNIDASWPN